MTKAFTDAVERNLKGLTAVSSGVCPGCEQCRDEYGQKVTCRHCNGTGYRNIRPWGLVDCCFCDGDGSRPPTMEEFEEQWSSGGAFSEPSFTCQGCDICGSSLGLDAEPWHALDDNNEIIHGEHCCQDCTCYLANGDIPEEWGR